LFHFSIKPIEFYKRSFFYKNYDSILVVVGDELCRTVTIISVIHELMKITYNGIDMHGIISNVVEKFRTNRMFLMNYSPFNYMTSRS